jgi:hypothetical protein
MCYHSIHFSLFFLSMTRIPDRSSPLVNFEYINSYTPQSISPNTKCKRVFGKQQLDNRARKNPQVNFCGKNGSSKIFQMTQHYTFIKKSQLQKGMSLDRHIYRNGRFLDIERANTTNSNNFLNTIFMSLYNHDI